MGGRLAKSIREDRELAQGVSRQQAWLSEIWCNGIDDDKKM
jgi:hypothetical protein